MSKKNLKILSVLVCLCCLLFSVEGMSQAHSERASTQAAGANKIRYSNKKSGLKAKTVQSAIDEVGTQVSTIISGGAKKAGLSTKAGPITTWSGKRYFYPGPPRGGAGETLSEAPVTITFSAATADSGTITVTPVNFLCEIESDFDIGSPDECICGTYGDTFSYSYRIFGSNLFVDNGRRSSGELIGACGDYGGEVLEIQSQGPERLVLKFVDQVITVWDLYLSK